MTTASKLIQRALSIADCKNTDFFTHQDQTDFLNDSYTYIMQQIIEHNLDIFTVEANLYGAQGVYPLPWDCYQIKSVLNPYSGRQIIRKTDSFSKTSSGYKIVNGNLVIDGINPGPISIIYWRKPYFISIPDRTLDDLRIDGKIIDTSENNILWMRGDTLFLWTPKGSEPIDMRIDDSIKALRLIRDEWVYVEYEISDEETVVELVSLDDGSEIVLDGKPDHLIRDASGMLWFGYDEDDRILVKNANGDVLNTLPALEDGEEYVRIGEDFEIAMKGAFPIGYFDNRPAYTLGQELHLINPDGSEIVEKLNLPIMRIDGSVKYGIISNGRIYSNIPDTVLDFPNNILYDLIAYRVAMYLVAKQNAENQGVSAMYEGYLKMFLSSMDQNAGYQRLNSVR